MKASALTLAVVIGLAASLAQADNHIPLVKTKTAILPSGGFYSLYSGTCHDNTEAAIARLDRGRDWCFSADGKELSCVNGRQEAIALACAKTTVASTQDADELETIQ